MDDILILAADPAGKLRRAVKVVNQTLAALSLEKHPDKTFIAKSSEASTFSATTAGLT